MLLFCDGFENFGVFDLHRKWGYVEFGTSSNSTTKEYTSADVSIVSGYDTSTSPPIARARHQRALSFRNYVTLGTPIDRSRTVFLGFALRTTKAVAVRLRFICKNNPTRVPYVFDWETPPSLVWGGGQSATSPNSVAVCDMFIRSDRVDSTWSFHDPSLTNQYTQVVSNTNLLSGGWYYYQAGFTVLGSGVDNPQGWVENRIGNRPNKAHRIENIYTTRVNGENSFYVSGVSMHFACSDASCRPCIDDVYIANDAGNVNNGFLGNVSVRSTWAVAEGIKNQAVPHGGNTLFRMEHVSSGDSGFVKTFAGAPSVPDVYGDASVVPHNPLDTHLTLERDGDTQLIRFTHTNFAGSEPNILGIALSAMHRSGHRVGLPSSLCPVAISGDSEIHGRAPNYSPIPRSSACGEFSLGGTVAYPALNNYHHFCPLGETFGQFCSTDIATYGFHLSQCFFENDGSSPSFWNTVAVNNADYGFTLGRFTGDAEDTSVMSLRNSLSFDEPVYESILFTDYSSRHFETQIVSSFGLSVSPVADWGASVHESMNADCLCIPSRGFPCFCEEYLYSKDEFRMDFISLEEFVSFADSLDFSWHAGIDDAIGLTAWTTSWHCEQVVSIHTSTVRTTGSVASLVSESFTVAESDIWDNHLDIGEDVFINVSYVFSGHELAEESLSLNSVARNGVGMDISDGLIILEEHHDGWWVELFSSNAALSCDVKTQQWRHVWLMGVCIQSWQIDPIEQPGMTDGNRVGDLDSAIFG